MSKEIQIRDGNLIASFDLENEDGDIDFCKLLKVSHGIAEEIGMFVDYVATNKIIGDQSKQIAELQKQLEEKEEDNQFLKKMYLSERTKNNNYHTEKYGLDKAVEELRKIKLNEILDDVLKKYQK